jgi:hypothetical protein
MNGFLVYISREACGVPGRGAWPPSIGGGRAAAGGTPAGGGMDLTWDLRPSGPGTRNCIIIYLMQADLGPFAGCKQTWDLGSPTQHLAQSGGWNNTVHGPGTPNTKRKQLSGCHSQARALFRSDGVALWRVAASCAAPPSPSCDVVWLACSRYGCTDADIRDNDRPTSDGVLQ